MACSMAPLRDLVVAKLVEVEKKTASGLYIAGTLPGVRKATVVATGPTTSGAVCVGSIIFVGQIGGLETELDGEKVVIFSEEEIIGVEQR